MRTSVVGRVLVWTLCATVGCFTDQPTENDDDDESATGSTSTTTTASTSTTTTTSAGATSTSTGSTTDDPPPTTGGTGLGSTGTTGVFDCSCPVEAWHCMDFEGTGFTGGWGGAQSTGNEPAVGEAKDAPCGDSVATTSVPQNGIFSTVGAQFDGLVVVPRFSVRMFAHVDPSCTDTAVPTRVAQVQLLESPGVVEYGGELWISTGGGELRGSTIMGGTVAEDFGLESTPAARWLDIELAIDLTAEASTELFIDGEPITTLETMLDPTEPLSDHTLNLSLGMFRSGDTFTDPCAMQFDAVSVVPLL